MSISSLGIGSGLDLENLVNSLVAAEIAPQVVQLDQKEASLQTEISALGTLKASLDNFAKTLEDFSDPDNFLARRVSSGNADLFTVEAEESAAPSTYSVEVQQLAEAQRLRSAAFADEETAIGTGTLTFQIGEETLELTLTEENNTLAQIRDAINAAPDNPGFSATIVSGDDGAFLLLSPDETGTENALTITASGDSAGLEGLTFDPNDLAGSGFTEENAAVDSVIVVDGVTITSSTNTITSAIEGVTISLVGAEVGTQTSLTVEVNTSRVESRVDSFVFQFDSLIETINALTAFDAESETAGPLLGDSTVRILEDRLRSVIGNPVDGLNGSFDTLSDIGITLNFADGTLQTDRTIEGFGGVQTVSEAIEQDLEGLAELFASENGIANQLAALVAQYVEEDGFLETRIDGLESEVDDIDDRRDELNDRSIELEEQLRAEFLALDLLVAELSSTSQFLSEQLALLPGPTEL
jgi:flagellar hook-associated protein 2